MELKSSKTKLKTFSRSHWRLMCYVVSKFASNCNKWNLRGVDLYSSFIYLIKFIHVFGIINAYINALVYKNTWIILGITLHMISSTRGTINSCFVKSIKGWWLHSLSVFLNIIFSSYKSYSSISKFSTNSTGKTYIATENLSIVEYRTI